MAETEEVQTSALEWMNKISEDSLDSEVLEDSETWVAWVVWAAWEEWEEWEEWVVFPKTSNSNPEAKNKENDLTDDIFQILLFHTFC